MSRAAILARVRANRPPPTAHPGVAPPREVVGDRVRTFTEQAAVSASRVVRIGANQSLGDVLAVEHPGRSAVATTPELVPHLSGVLPADGFALAPVTPATPIAQLAGVELAVLRAAFGVLENGALWLPEPHMGHRALPYSAEHLVLLVGEGDFVATMHEAYRRADPIGGFGCFIAGPSKTADIEQSLVIGAQGPRSLLVAVETFG